MTELKEAASRLKTGKAPGPDKITSGALKEALNTIPAFTLETYNKQLQKMKFPKIWKTAKLVIIPKANSAPDEDGIPPHTPICFLDSPGCLDRKRQGGRLRNSGNKGDKEKECTKGPFCSAYKTPGHRYGIRVKTNSERSGAYLFLPDGDAVPFQLENIIVNVIEGSILSSVFLQLPYVHHSTTLYNTTGADGLGIEIQNVVDIENTSNFELAMRLSTNINSGENFFTDVNGYQIVRRKRFTKLPLQANYYPMPTTAYIEDENLRFTVTTSSPLGCSSLSPGQLEIMLDRRLNQDDNLGLGQGVMDNHPTRHVFRILLEKKRYGCKATAKDHPAGFPTLSAHVASQTLLNPLVRLLKMDDGNEFSSGGHAIVEREIGIDFSLPTLRTNIFIKERTYIGLIIHRQFLDVCFSNKHLLQRFRMSDGSVNISDLIPVNARKENFKTSLSFSVIKIQVDLKKYLQMCPMETQAFVLGS
ncbi:hypothetical protein JTB14_033078 [Gonioctena quinquepunctata]|nr:hypothetical protein JTB14_033078 [Gonioctena quinquepunctata]